ncbi:hypothetical protein FRC06_001691 [Ceratobasidium sp. 370]|nr:hypothetical protein FRC06_001691 [Ceratobasidium sp. 370]
MARCWVLFGRGQYVLVLLIAGFLASLAASVSVLTLQVPHSTYLSNPLPGIFVGCFVLPTSNAWLPFIFSFIFETIILIATAWRTRTLMSEFGPMPLVDQLYKDGSIFYAAILLVILFTCIGATIPSVELAAVGSGIYPALGSVLCNRLILSLHGFRTPTTPSTLAAGTSGTFGLGIPMATFQVGQGTTLGGPGNDPAV